MVQGVTLQGFSWVKMGLRCSKLKICALRSLCYHVTLLAYFLPFHKYGGYAAGIHFASTLDANVLTIVQAPWCYHLWFKDYQGLPLYIYMQTTEMYINRI